MNELGDLLVMTVGAANDLVRIILLFMTIPMLLNCFFGYQILKIMITISGILTGAVVGLVLGFLIGGSVGGVIFLLLFAILFGRCYAVRYGLFLTPLLGVALISIVLAAVSLYAYLIVRKTVPATPEQREERQLLAAGLFMNYGALTCTVLALAHGVMQYAWCAALLFFIDSALLCSSVMQLRDHAEENNRKWEKTALIHVLLFNPLLVLLIYFFIKLM